MGFKYEVVNGADAPWHFSIIGQVSLPTGEEVFGADDPEPEVKLLWSTDLSEEIALAGNVNGAWRDGEEGGFFEPAVSLSLSTGLSDPVAVYAEYFAFLGWDDTASEAHYLSAGATYQVTQSFQVDARMGVGLHANADDVFAGVGFGVLF